MTVRKTLLIFACSFLLAKYSFSQDSSRFFFTTGAGLIKVTPALHHVLKPAVAFNSGLEFDVKKQWYLQFTVDFNTLKYDQHLKDESSNLLFQNTNSSLLMLGLNAGKNFRLNNTWFLSSYVGEGFMNIGEPRITVDNNIATQQVLRKSSAFTRVGTRAAHRIKSKFFQTLYFDASWWGSPLNVQGYKLNGFSFLIGTRMAM